MEKEELKTTDEQVSSTKEKKKKSKLTAHQIIYKMCATAIFAALTFLVTFFIQIPIVGGAGYVNFSDIFIAISAIMIDPISGMLVGIIGATLADIISGFAIYAPFTAVIKALEALVIGFGFKLIKRNFKYVFIVLGTLLNPLLYMIPDRIYFGVSGMLGSLPFNCIQALVASIFTIVTILFISNTSLEKYIQQPKKDID